MWRGKDKNLFSGGDVFLGLGSNIGNRENNIVSALKALETCGCVKKISSIYETASLLRDDQGKYLNIICLFDTRLKPLELLTAIQKIENDLGRDRSAKKWGERIIDIDIIDFGGSPLDVPRLRLPHREASRRSFVLYPLAEICPGYVHPITGIAIDDLINSIEDGLDIRKFKDRSNFSF